MKNKLKIISLFLVILFSLSSCKAIQKLTYRNKDFEFVNKSKIEKVVIQGTRDKGFRFLVTDGKTIEDLYDSLSAGMPVSEKSELEPDYIFEFHAYDNTIKKYYYVAGLSNDDTKGNLYNEDSTYYVMNRIDNDLIKNMLVLRKPINFIVGYYGGIETLVKRVKQDYPEKTISVMINEDIEMMKYHLSFEILQFQRELANMGVGFARKNTEADVVINISTKGYNSTMIKLGALVRDNVIKKEKSYYLRNEYKDKVWSSNVYENMPNDF